MHWFQQAHVSNQGHAELERHQVSATLLQGRKEELLLLYASAQLVAHKSLIRHQVHACNVDSTSNK